MDTLRYTASARLGVWDSLTRKRDEFLDDLARILQDNSHAVLEAYHIEDLCLTDPGANPSLASVTAICDKIIVRGNPTLVDLDFERTLLKGPCQQYLSVEELGEEEPNVGFKFSEAKFPGKRDALFRAAKDLLCLPYRNETESSTDTRELPPDLTDLTSEEEDLFAEQFCTAFGEYLGTKLHRQVLIRDLVNRVDNNLEQSRVDFVFQSDSIRWVFEIDGQQHNEQGQRRLDKQRDIRLKENGWVVHRIPAEDVRRGLENLFEDLKKELAQILSEYDSVQTAIAESEVHAAAFNSILLPLAVQRCLRGLLFLYSHEILDPARQQRVLIIEEDCPVVAESFRILCAIWARIHTLVPDTLPAPKLKLDIIGESPNWGKTDAARYLDAPDNNYDLILSHSLLLDAGCIGSTEKTHFPNRPRNFICLRRAIGLRAERSLQECNALHYDLADIEHAIASQKRGNPEPMPHEKHEALLFFLRHVFRKRNFWDGQLHVIARLLQGKASIVLLPTGGGKSLTYHLSGLLLPGMTIIIDPLVSLMNDQVENLKTAGIDLVDHVSSQQDHKSKQLALQNMESGKLAFIFIAPERLQTKDFRSRLQTVVNNFPVSLAVIDEAHCVSEWGHDFRPSYLHMPRNLKNYCSSAGSSRKPTLVGLTGTASFAVLADIQMEMQVKGEEAIVLPRSFDRKELCFQVIDVPMSEKSAKLKAIKRELPRRLHTNSQKFCDPRGDHTNSGIVFCPHVNGELGVISVAEILGHRNFYAGEKPKKFDGKWPDYKKDVQRKFKRNHIQEIVATKSFGMGIDKPNIRYTVHYTVPQSVEAFYQEAGRAGRNGKPQYALCSILYSDDNWDSALEILNEPDHPQALKRINSISWNNRGDLLFQLWLLLQSYRGQLQEKKITLNFWSQKLEPAVTNMQAAGATNTIEIPFNRGKEGGKEENERSIFRLMLLGVVQDYTIDWQKSSFSVTVKRISPSELKRQLHRYLMNYKFRDFADSAVNAIPEDTTGNALQAAINVLIDFVYEEIAAKRKQALRTMGELCRNFTSDQEFREAILAYLQESEFSDELRNKWVGHSFDDIGMAAIHDLLGRVTALEEVKRLIGTTRRMLDEDPQNLALRYLSTCSRAQSGTESDSSILQETTAFVRQINHSKEDISDPERMLLSMLNDIADRRSNLLDEASNIVFRQAGTVALARLTLRSKRLAAVKRPRAHAVNLLLDNVRRTLAKSDFYKNLPLPKEASNA